MTPRGAAGGAGSAPVRDRGSRRVTAVIVGAGHNGLAMSHCLATLGVDHVVLERGEVANSWRHERWDSLHLLTPNWQTRLPGYRYAGNDPDGYMSMPEVIEFISAYARLTAAPVHTGTTVSRVQSDGAGGFLVHSDRGSWRCRAVVVASGAFGVASVPACAAALPRAMHTLTTSTYKRPEQLPDGGVLVVGASASGVQLAWEIHGSGRPVTLAVGEHVRMPRCYRGRDVQWWMDAAGILDEHYTEVDDIERARRVPSPQLAGTPERQTLDLNVLRRAGVTVTGRLMSVRDGQALFSGSLRNQCALADLKMNRLLDAFDAWACQSGLHDALAPPERFEPSVRDAPAALALDLGSGAIRSIVWATGHRPDLSWLDLPVRDRKGRLQHDGGVGAVPGLYVMGLPFLRRRKSSFMHGAAADAGDLAVHLKRYLDGSVRRISAGMLGA